MGHVIGRPVCVMVLLAVVGAARADDYHMLNVTWPQTCGWDGAYRPGRWLPLELLITGDVNLKKPLNCRLTLSLQQDSMTDMTVTHNFVATPNVNTYLPMAVPAPPQRLDLRRQDHRRRGQNAPGAPVLHHQPPGRAAG